MNVYIDKSVDNGLIYDENIIEINKVKSPAVLIILGNHENKTDSKWMVENIKSLGKAISKGIVKGFSLKVC